MFNGAVQCPKNDFFNILNAKFSGSILTAHRSAYKALQLAENNAVFLVNLD